MTREEQTIANLKKLKSFHNGSYGMDIDRAIKALEQEQKSEWQKDHEILKVYSDGANEALDRVRAEIEGLTYYCCEVHPKYVIDDVLKIIDKYKGEGGE